MSERPTPTEQRATARERLAGGPFDLLVIGGGAIGLSTAWLAAREGLRVALVEAGDFAGATSSASSKLVHGGLRYLALGDVALVREAHQERLALGRTVAPHLVRPLPFLMPLYEGGPHSTQKIRAGVLLYSALSRFRDGRGRIVRADEAKARVPALRTEALKGCGLYGDHQTNDARLALAIHRAAVDAGVVALNYAAVEELRFIADRVAGAEVVDRFGGERFSVGARVVVNATGPWVDRLRALEDPAQGQSVRLSKGTHIVMRALEEWHSALTIPVDDVRVRLLDELAHSGQGCPAPVPEFGDSFRDQIRCRLALARVRLFHVVNLESSNHLSLARQWRIGVWVSMAFPVGCQRSK